LWIYTERDAEAKRYLRSIVELNMMEERRRASFFARQREMDREEYEEKQEQERAHKHEKA
jgi:hypothetical protein